VPKGIAQWGVPKRGQASVLFDSPEKSRNC
jgi:hypothetical protein